MAEISIAQQLEKMKRDWDERARENARCHVNTERREWSDEEFFRPGQRTIEEEILTDMGNICQGKDPRTMRVLEIGCGAGRRGDRGKDERKGANEGDCRYDESPPRNEKVNPDTNP